MAETADLIARLEAAPVGSSELDAEIAVAVFETVNTGDDLIYAKLPHKDDGCARGTYWRKSRSGMSLQTALPYTRSLDSAMTLVPEGWVGNLEVGSRIALQGMRCELWNGEFGLESAERKAEAATPALALVLAALRARGET